MFASRVGRNQTDQRDDLDAHLGVGPDLYESGSQLE
jgi:hypothetical protein